ncbi:hypothetical protein ACH4KN_11450 [Streptomyces sp. NPDC017546]|uniref:hypothetical protein n=1 Tax=unclassified Streptomyces TaxID=2593676 RepID=UPI00235EF930|nr:hypothetical protein [Streptomyces sp. MMBL 11-1]
MPLLELSDHARRSEGHAAFVGGRLTKEPQKPFAELSTELRRLTAPILARAYG